MIDALPGWIHLRSVEWRPAFIANFAHDDAIGTVAACSGEKLTRRDGNLPCKLFNGLVHRCSSESTRSPNLGPSQRRRIPFSYSSWACSGTP
jgi:hypothetical protein